MSTNAHDLASSMFLEQKQKEMQSLNPYPFYALMRQNNPIFFNPERNAWEFYLYEDIQRVLGDYKGFSSEKGIPDRIQIEENMETRSLVKTDPPRHKQLRPLVAQAFTPRTLARMIPRVTDLVHQHLDAVADKGTMDVAADFSSSVPVMVIAELLGIPTADRRQFKHWSDAIIGTSQESCTQALREMNPYFKNIIAQRRVIEKDDLISALLHAEADGVQLTEQEVLTFCALLLVAGTETTTNLINNTLLCLDAHPEVAEELRSNLSLVPDTIEEVLRYLSPLQWVIRCATSSVSIRDKIIRDGQVVLLCLGSANRDEAQFQHPDQFDIHRTSNRHLAFGHSIHHCLGSSLARMEMNTALPILLSRFREIRRIQIDALERFPSTFVYGVKNLHVKLHA